MLRIIAVCVALLFSGQAVAKGMCEIPLQEQTERKYFEPGNVWVSTDPAIVRAIKEVIKASRIPTVVCEYTTADDPVPFAYEGVVYFPQVLKARFTYDELVAIFAHETGHVARGTNRWVPDSEYLADEIATDRLAARWVGKAKLIAALEKTKLLKEEFSITPEGIAKIDRRIWALRRIR